VGGKKGGLRGERVLGGKGSICLKRFPSLLLNGAFAFAPFSLPRQNMVQSLALLAFAWCIGFAFPGDRAPIPIAITRTWCQALPRLPLDGALAILSVLAIAPYPPIRPESLALLAFGWCIGFSLAIAACSCFSALAIAAFRCRLLLICILSFCRDRAIVPQQFLFFLP